MRGTQCLRASWGENGRDDLLNRYIKRLLSACRSLDWRSNCTMGFAKTAALARGSENAAGDRGGIRTNGDLTTMQDQFAAWAKALTDKAPIDTEVGNPRSGYFRLKNEAIAIWRDDDGYLLCWRSDPKAYTPSKPDEIDDLFSFACKRPITYEAYQEFVQSGKWPEDVEPVQPASSEPDKALAEELAAQQKAAKEWLTGLGHKPQTQEEADKAANFANEFAKIEAKAFSSHKEEKAEPLELCRLIDEKWLRTRDAAKTAKTWAKTLNEDFLIAEKRRLAEEDRKRREEAARAAQEAEAARLEAEKANMPPPPPTPVPLAPAPVKAKAGTSGRANHLRDVPVHEITDVRALLTFFSNMNAPPAELVAVLQTLVNRMRAAGAEVPGVTTRIEQKVA